MCRGFWRGDNRKAMAQDYDVVLKLLFRSKSSQAVREIAGGAVKRWLDKELPAIRNTRADLIAETIGGEIVHLEFMSENQKFFELRMAGYYVEIYQAWGRHPRQALVYVGRPKLRMGGHFKSPTLTFRFRVVDLRELNGERFLDSRSVVDQILALLMRLKIEGKPFAGFWPQSLHWIRGPVRKR